MDYLEFAKEHFKKAWAVVKEPVTVGCAREFAIVALSIAQVEATQVQNEHLEYIRGHLNVIASALTSGTKSLGSIAGTLENARGPGGAIKTFP